MEVGTGPCGSAQRVRKRNQEGEREKEWDFKNLRHVKIVPSYIQSYTHFNYMLIIKVCVCVCVVAAIIRLLISFPFLTTGIESSSESIRQMNGRPILREDLICHTPRPRDHLPLG